MQILADSCLALLASIGLWTLCSMLSECLFRKSKLSDQVIIMEILNDCPDSNNSFLKNLRVSHDFHLLLVYEEPDTEEEFRVEMPTEKHAGVLFCSCEKFCSQIKEAKKWTIQKSTTK